MLIKLDRARNIIVGRIGVDEIATSSTGSGTGDDGDERVPVEEAVEDWLPACGAGASIGTEKRAMYWLRRPMVRER